MPLVSHKGQIHLHCDHQECEVCTVDFHNSEDENAFNNALKSGWTIIRLPIADRYEGTFYYCPIHGKEHW